MDCVRETERGGGRETTKNKRKRGRQHVQASQEICGWKKNAHG
jgi:hypothetical protein